MATELTPTRKVTAGLIAGSILVIVVYTVKQIFSVDLPAEVVAAVQTLLTFAVQWQTKNNPRNPASPDPDPDDE